MTKPPGGGAQDRARENPDDQAWQQPQSWGQPAAWGPPAQPPADAAQQAFGQAQGWGQPNLPVPPGYGQPYPMPPQVHPRSSGVAVAASFFVPGLGSMLNDRAGKGITILITSIAAAILCIVLIGFILYPAVWIYGMVAANNDARAWNRDHGIIS